MRIAWFSPLPPSTSGIAAYSAELLPRLGARGHAIDTFTEANAHDFVWKQRRTPYDLVVHQLGNAACHDFQWAYLFRYPGLVVLHDAQLHQARALFLTRRWMPRRLDYLAEFTASHPGAPGDLGELIAAGLGGTLYHHWPLLRLVLERARLTVVHNARLAHDLRAAHPLARIETVEMGVADPRAALDADPAEARAAVLERHHLPADAVVVAAFGGVTPEKRIPQVIRALSAMASRQPRLHLLLVGAAAPHYDVRQDARAWGIADRVRVTGFVADAELPHYLHGADICACLRWPTNRETSASWLRCLAAARPTIITDLSHLADVPTLDPRGWTMLDARHADLADGDARQAARDSREPVAVSIDLLDEEHSLQLALERLAGDAPLRARLGRAARAWWARHHQLEPMAAAYEDVLQRAKAAPPPRTTLPGHLLADGSAKLRALAGDLGVTGPLADLLPD